MTVELLLGDCLETLKTLPDCSVQTCVTSPPYYRLRDYGVEGQIGLEETPEAYVAKLVAVFREVWRVLKPDGCVFLNLGDSYVSSSSKYGIIKENLSEEMIYEAAMGIRRHMPELWRTCWGKEGEGIVSKVLSEEIPRGTSRQAVGISTKGLSQTPESLSGQNSKEMAGEKGGGNNPDGREVCLLRGDKPDISLLRPHQGGRSKGLCEGRGASWSLEKSNCRGASKRQISSSLLELQCGIRIVRFLSSLKLDFSDIPDPIKIYFRKVTNLKPKDLIGIPWMVAFALRADGWWLRQDIIWSKPNPMPESVTDRCTKSHEYIFLLSKSAQYYYDAEAIAEPVTQSSIDRINQPNLENQIGSTRVPGKTNGNMKAVLSKNLMADEQQPNSFHIARANGEKDIIYPARNKRSVWTVTTKPYREAHFATFPPDLIEPCILAGSRPGDTVLDPFNGSGTTGEVSIKHRRNYIGLELKPDYIELTKKRLAKVQPVLMET